MNYEKENEEKYRVEIADVTGLSVVWMTKQEIIKVSKEKYIDLKIRAFSPARWIFIDSKMVNKNEIESMEMNTTQIIRVIPVLRGGCSDLDCSCGGIRRILKITKNIMDGVNSNGCWSHTLTNNPYSGILCLTYSSFHFNPTVNNSS